MLYLKNASLTQVDAYIKKSLKNQLCQTKRNQQAMLKRNVSLCSQMNNLITIDEYPFEEFCEVFKINSISVAVYDEVLYKALLKLKEKQRNTILLKYWEKLTDKKVGNVLLLNRKMANYHRNRALKQLKKIVEEIKENDKWIEL